MCVFVTYLRFRLGTLTVFQCTSSIYSLHSVGNFFFLLQEIYEGTGDIKYQKNGEKNFPSVC